MQLNVKANVVNCLKNVREYLQDFDLRKDLLDKS